MISIFNDVIGPVMRGASSSHCAAALRIGRLARDLMGGEIDHVLIEFDRNGSLPTHQSQGSDMGLFGGLLGWDAADERLPLSPTYLREAGVAVDIRYIDCHDPHPNTYRLTLSNAAERRTMIAISTGGGMIEVLDIDGQRVAFDGGAREHRRCRVRIRYCRCCRIPTRSCRFARATNCWTSTGTRDSAPSGSGRSSTSRLAVR